ncbi:hypothetical protein HYY69_01160 [Candidatus Woesearchaeota archaeon]|nr:hypothetical protein [Candidatus Woesearchaeota archaeon]
MLVVCLLVFTTLISLVYAAVYQPTGYQGSPYSDANPNFAGTDNAAGSGGSAVSVSNNDSDSTALEQALSQENVTVRISASDFDPNSTLSGNYTIGTSTGSEKGNAQNGTEVNGAGGAGTLGSDGDSAQAKASIERDGYYDFGSSINGSVWIKKTTNGNADASTNYLFNYTYCYYNDSWNCDAETQNTASGVTTNYQAYTITNKIINSSWGGGNDVTNYSLRVRVRGHDEQTAALNPGLWSGLSNVTAAAKNKTIQHRYKWIYSYNNGTTWNDGTSFSNWNSTLLRNGTSTFNVVNHITEIFSNITHYGLYVEVNGSDALYGNSDLFNATGNVTQSNLNLTQTAFTTVNTTYFPSTDTANTTLWFYGELGYAYGADANDYGGTGHPVNVSLYKPTPSGYSFIESKFPTLNANGAFSTNFTLSIRAQGGTWLIKTNYNSSTDTFPENSKTFIVRIIANQTKTYGFYGENTSAIYNLANTTNLQGEIRIETFIYNNPEGFTPNCNVTIQGKSTEQMTWNSTGLYCYNNTQAPTSTGEKSVQTNFTINGSSGATEDSFSSQNALLNVTDILIINATNSIFNVYNKGENVTHWGNVYNIRSEPLQGKTIIINLINSSGIVQNSNSSVSLDGNGFFNKTISIGFTNSSQNNATGESYRTRALFNSNNGNSTETTFSVSSLLSVTNIWTDKQEEGTDFPTGSEETSFFIGADVLYVRTHVTNVRGENVSDKMVYSNVTKTDRTLEETRNSWNSSTNSYGWNPFYNINVIAPANQRTVNSLANDTSGNSGSSTETITYSPSYTGNLNLDLWIAKESGNTDGHSFEQGDNITIYALFNKDGTATDVANNNSQITLYYGNSSVYISQTSMTYVSAGLYKYNFVIASDAVKTSYFTRVYGLLSGADQYGSVWYRVSEPPTTTYTSLNMHISTGSTYYTSDTLTINAYMYNQNGNAVTNASVNLTINYPNGTIFISNTNLSNDGNGDYSYSTNLGTVTGNYNLRINATQGNLNASAIESFSVISAYSSIFVSTSSVAKRQGDNATIRSYLKYQNTTAVTNANITYDIYYPNSTIWLNSSNATEEGNGFYNFSFNIPSTAVLGDYKIVTTAIKNPTDTDVSTLSVLKKVSGTMIDITNYVEVEAGNNYVAEISVKDEEGNYVNADSTPKITLIDPLGDVSVGPTTSGVTTITTGRYNYTKATASSATGGQWQVLANVSRGGNYYENREYFKITSGPFDVRDISIIDTSVPTLSISVVLENTGGAIKDMYVEWNLTRTDTGALLDSGADTVAVAGSSAKTHTISPSTSYIGDVKITFLGWYGTDFTERAGAFKTFMTTSAPVGEGTPGGGAGGGTGGESREEATPSSTEEIVKESSVDIDLSKLIKAASVRVAKGQTITFRLDEKTTHRLTVDSLSDTSAQITVQSEPQTFVLNVGEYKKLSLDGGLDNLKITLQSIKDGVAEISIEKIDQESKIAPGEESAKETETIQEKERKAPSKSTQSYWLSILVLIVMGLLIYIIKKKETIKELLTKKHKAKEKVTRYNFLNAKNIIIVILGAIVLVSLLLNISIKEIPSKIISVLSAVKLPSVSLNWWVVFGILVVLLLFGILIILFYIFKEIKKLVR